MGKCFFGTTKTRPEWSWLISPWTESWYSSGQIPCLPSCCSQVFSHGVWEHMTWYLSNCIPLINGQHEYCLNGSHVSFIFDYWKQWNCNNSLHVTAFVNQEKLLMPFGVWCCSFGVLVMSCCILHKHSANAAVNTSTHGRSKFPKWWCNRLKHELLANVWLTLTTYTNPILSPKSYIVQS
jgi:hypothetical protein